MLVDNLKVAFVNCYLRIFKPVIFKSWKTLVQVKVTCFRVGVGIGAGSRNVHCQLGCPHILLWSKTEAKIIEAK